MKDFAKLYQTKKYGQILVVIDEGESGPEIRFSFTPKGLGLCSIATKFTDSSDGWDRAESAFNSIGLMEAVQIVTPTILMIESKSVDMTAK